MTEYRRGSASTVESSLSESGISSATEHRRGSTSTVASSISDSSGVSSADSCQITVRLLDLVSKTEYEIVQENGQRRLTAPELTPELRECLRGAEVFLGRLPRDCYEDELMPVLEKAGRLLELRLMLDFSGLTRGYAFALYPDSKTARKACQMLDGYKIRPGHLIGAVKSIDNCRLFFGGVPKNKSKEEFLEELSKLMDGIVDIYLYPNSQDRTLNRGFIFVEFKDHRSAAMARRKLIPGRVLLWDHEVAVDWADPEPGEPVDEEIMEKVSALFVRNLEMDDSQQKIRDIFQKATNIHILKLKKINHFAFVHYENRFLAEKAMQILTMPGGVAEANQWEIKWAKPIGPIKQAERLRSINEAIMQSKNANANCRNISKHSNYNDTNTKKIVKGQIPDWPLHVNGDGNLPLANQFDMQYVAVLSDFVSKVMGAVCSFEPIFNANGIVHKVTIFKDNTIILEDFGPIQPTRQSSLDAAATIIYQKLKSVYDYHIYSNMHPPMMVDEMSSQMGQLNLTNGNEKIQFRPT